MIPVYSLAWAREVWIEEKCVHGANGVSKLGDSEADKKWGWQ